MNKPTRVFNRQTTASPYNAYTLIAQSTGTIRDHHEC